MSSLIWTPSAMDASTVRATWYNAALPYVLHWGDGDKVECEAGAAPVTHSYAETGTYDLVAVAERDYTAAARLTVRSWVTPPVPGRKLDGRTLTLTMPQVPEPVQWRVDWGDGEHSIHTGSTAVHTYTSLTGHPPITVTDEPSRRKVRFVGPEIPTDKPPEFPPVDGVLWRWRTGRTFDLIGGGLDPNSKVEFWGIFSAKTFEVYADSAGNLVQEFTTARPSEPNMDQWRTYVVRYRQHGQEYVRFLPLNVPYAKTPMVHYEFGSIDPATMKPTGDPFAVTFGVNIHQTGRHFIDFGDGTSQTVDLRTGPLRVTHVYPRETPSKPYEVTVTLPDGRKTWPCEVAPHTCHTDVQVLGPRVELVWCRSSGDECQPPDQFTPVIIEWVSGYNPRLQRLHNPIEVNRCWLGGYSFGIERGSTVQYRFHRPLMAPSEVHTLVVPRSTVPQHDEQPERRLVPVGEDVPELELSFGEVTEWDGGYSGYFTIRNEGTEATPWVVEFDLSDPAYLREVWGAGSPRYEELTGGRWRIWSDTPIPAGTDARVGVRVEPSGQPRGPQGMTVRKGRM